MSVFLANVFQFLVARNGKCHFHFFFSRGKNFQNTFWWFEVLSSGHAKFTLRTTHYTLHWKCREGLGNLLFTSSMWISKLSDLEYLYKPTLVVLIIWTEWCEKWLIWMMEFTVIEENMFQQQKTTEDIRTPFPSMLLSVASCITMQCVLGTGLSFPQPARSDLWKGLFNL